MKPLKENMVDVFNENLLKMVELLELVAAQNHKLHKINVKLINIELLLGRMKLTMATDFQSLLTEVQSQGTELDKIQAEVQAGNSSVVTADQLDQLKAALDANQTKLKAIDDLHPDTQASGSAAPSGDSGSSSADAGSSASSDSTGSSDSSGSADGSAPATAAP